MGWDGRALDGYFRWGGEGGRERIVGMSGCGGGGGGVEGSGGDFRGCSRVEVLGDAVS